MLNKETMLIKKTEKDFTHILIPEMNPNDNLVRGYSAGKFGKIIPTELTLKNPNHEDINYSIDAFIYDGGDIDNGQLFLNGYLDIYTDLYLGRSDTKENIGTPITVIEKSGNAYWQNSFTISLLDLGKEIPIWISSTPPPY